MKRIIAFFLVLLTVLSLTACQSGTNADEKEPTTTTRPPVDRGTELASWELKNTAERYVKKQFSGTTVGGYKITSFTIGSSKEIGGDDLYTKYVFSGTYDFINKYGEKEHKTWDMHVKVYKWSLNPDHRTEVTYY